MRKTVTSATVAVLVSAVFASGSAFAAGKPVAKDKTKYNQAGHMAGGKSSEKTVDLEIKVGKRSATISGIPADKLAEYEAVQNQITGDSLKVLPGEVIRDILAALVNGDAKSKDLAKEAQDAASKGFADSAKIASIAARAGAHEDGFTDKEATNVLEFVKAFNEGKDNQDGLERAARSQLGKDATQEQIIAKIKEILKACETKA